MNPDIASIPLRDIHLPESVSWWPLAPGWWIMLGLLILAAAVVFFLKTMKDRKQLDKQVMDEFQSLVDQYKNDRDTNALLANVSKLLRRVSMTRFSQEEVAALTGDRWLKFLDETLVNAKNTGSLNFHSELGELLVSSQYQKSQSIDENKLDQLLMLSKRWLLVSSNQSIKRRSPESINADA